MSSAVVECTAGARYPDRPRSLVWEGERVMVDAVEREWRTPDGLVFRVNTADGRRFTLTYDEAVDAWDVQPAAGAHSQASRSRNSLPVGASASQERSEGALRSVRTQELAPSTERCDSGCFWQNDLTASTGQI